MMNIDDLYPKFLCIGAQKAATSWLWTMLRQNPGIWMPPIKELHFFDHVYIPENREWTLGHIRKGVTEALKWHIEHKIFNFDHFRYLIDMGSKNLFTEDWYKQCYDRPAAKGKVTGDITPEYSTLPLEGVEHVRSLLGPDIRIIYIIRNPVERALSQLKMNLTRKGQENKSEEFWVTSAKDPVIYQRGDYQTYIPRWEHVFPKENIFYIPYQRTTTDPQGLLRDVARHIGVADFQRYSGIKEKIHKTKEAKIPRSCHDLLNDKLSSQFDFIVSRFGREFADQT